MIDKTFLSKEQVIWFDVILSYLLDSKLRLHASFNIQEIIAMTVKETFRELSAAPHGKVFQIKTSINESAKRIFWVLSNEGHI